MECSKLQEKIGPRIVHLRGEKETQQQLADAIGVKREIVAFWETRKRCPNTEQIKKIADHFHVSADYILGLSDIESPDKTVQAICEYTGLSEKAVELLHLANTSEVSESRRTLHFLNMVLGEYMDKHPLPFPSDDLIDTLFSTMDRYVTADQVELRSPITFSSEDVSEGYMASELYRQLKMMQIMKELDSYQNKEEK